MTTSAATDRLPAGFWILTASQAISLAGNGVQQIALPLWIYLITGSATSAGLAFAVQFVPLVVLAPWAGHLVDRFDRRRVLIVCELLSAVAVLVLLLGVVQEWLVLVYLALPALRAFNAGAMPALQAASMHIVPRKDHNRMATVIEGMLGGVNTLAPLGGTALAAAVGIRWVLLANLVSFLVSAVLLVWVPPCPGTPGLRGGFRSTTTALRQNARNRVLSLVALAEAGYFLFFGADTAVLLLLAEQEVGPGLAGVCATGAGLGWLAASTLVIRRFKHRPLAIMIVSAVLCPVAAGLVVLSTQVGSVGMLLASMALGAVNIGVAAGATVIYQQQLVSGTEGRVNAMRRAILNCVLTASYLALPAIAGTTLGPAATLLTLALVTGVVVAGISILAARAQRSASESSSAMDGAVPAEALT